MLENNQKQLDQLLKIEQKNQLSSQEEEDQVSVYQHPQSRSGFRKPIKNPFSDHSDDQDSSDQQFTKNDSSNNNNSETMVSPFPPKQPKQRSVLEQAQSTMKWNRDEENQIQILSKLEGQGMKDKKIRQLASKYKTLNIAYQKQKTMRKNLENQLNAQLKVNEEIACNRSMQKENTIKSNMDKSLVKSQKCMNSTCQQNEKKVMQFRLQSQNLKSQLNKAYRVISRQIGQNFNIDQILNQENSWKGRQQKIQKLKIRVKELEQKLVNNGVNVSHMSGFTQVSSATRTNNNFSTTRTSTMAQNKRKQFDNLKIQVQTLKSDNQLLQGKIKSITSRKFNLQSQLKQLKNQFEKKKLILIEKSQNDDKFISLLKSENQRLKKQERVVTKVVYKDQKDNDQNLKLKKQIERLKSKLIKEQKKSQEIVQQKVLEKVEWGNEQDEKIQIKFPPTQKKRNSVQKFNNKKSESNIAQRPISSRQVSAQKRRQIQSQHLKGNKYLKKLTPEEESSIYQNWKSGKKI